MEGLVVDIDYADRRRSALILRPRPYFLEWLAGVVGRRGFALSEVYFPEEISVWLIPPVGTFNSQDALDTFLSTVKREATRLEMGVFGATPEDVPVPLDDAACDRFFEFEVRDLVREFPSTPDSR